MASPTITYAQRDDDTSGEVEATALSNIYRLVLDRAKNETTGVGEPEAGVEKHGEVSHVNQQPT